MSLNQQEALQFLRTLELNPHKPYTPADFKKQWRKLCQRFHPDKHTQKAYDDYVKDKEACEKEGGVYTGEIALDPSVANAKFLEVTHAYNMLTDRNYCRKHKYKNHPMIDLNVQVPMGVSFDEAFFGTTVILNVAVREYTENGNCLNDGERGKPFTVQKIKVDVPPGTYQPIPVTVKGKGCVCGSDKGDVIVIVQPQPSDKFKMTPDGDVESPIHIPLKTLLKGGEAEVLTMYGIKKVKIPPGTQPNDRIAIANCGVEQQGKHIGIIQMPKIPKKDELKSDPAWEGLGFDFDMESDVEEREDEKMQRIFMQMNAAGFGSATTGGF